MRNNELASNWYNVFLQLLAYKAVSLRVVLVDCIFLSLSFFSPLCVCSWVQLDKANTRSERNALRNSPRPLLRPCNARISSDESNSSLRTKLSSPLNQFSLFFPFCSLSLLIFSYYLPFFSFSFIILFSFTSFYSQIKINGTMRFVYVRFLFLISGCAGVSRSETREYERTRSFLREKRHLLFPDPKDSETKVQVCFLSMIFFLFLRVYFYDCFLSEIMF